MKIENEQQLEERMSRPTAADVDAMRALEGDVLILGVGGKMGPTLAQLVRRSADAAGKKTKILGVARFTDKNMPDALRAHGVEPIVCDLLEPERLAKLPDAENVIFMAARKFGTTGAEHLSWAINTQLPALVADRYRHSRIVCFSSGNVYPLVPAASGGADEQTPVGPQGEYAQSVLGRERVFEHASHRWATRVTILRLNYAIDLRYGVLVDIARAVFERRPVDVRMPLVNIIWQGDANSVALRSIAHCDSPPFVLNLTGPETLSTRWIAEQFAQRFGQQASFSGEESSHALLNNSAKCHQLFGYPTVAVGTMMDWIADWIASGGAHSNKPTHFQTQDGKF
ncbi:MAG TPA: NAD-dependent epimerase/dehydratase family protein [Acidobacteriaceae bacterium]|nr:NAD-dependent epimerase/dehydratase family protein [Acidobacteriaceae bacterium]